MQEAPTAYEELAARVVELARQKTPIGTQRTGVGFHGTYSDGETTHFVGPFLTETTARTEAAITALEKLHP